MKKLQATRTSPYAKPHYDGSDTDLTRTIDGKGKRMDYESGLYYPEYMMEQGPDGNWYLRGNVDADAYGYSFRGRRGYRPFPS